MDLEIRDTAPSQRDRHTARLKSYEVELARLEKEFNRAQKSLPNESKLCLSTVIIALS